jgi:hypothetical protein
VAAVSLALSVESEIFDSSFRKNKTSPRKSPGSDDHGAKKVTKVYRALSDWQDGKLETTDQLLNALAEARLSVLGLDSGWRKVALPFFRVLDVSINKRLGATLEELHKLETQYDDAGD